MNTFLKNVLRPFYLAALRIPGFKELLSRAAAQHWDTYLIQDFIRGDYGEAYGLKARDKAKLVDQFRRNITAIPSGTSLIHHVILAREIFSIDKELAGDVVECGCWKGASSTSLSLICRAAGRKLVVCDSFQGLPEEKEQIHLAPHAGFYGYYKEGMFCGRLDEVRDNIRRLGALDVCEFVPGFFSDTLHALTRPIAFAFLDVDLVSSTQDCLRHIWPLLVPGGMIYTDDAVDLEVVGVFFNEPWWQENLHCSAPGYVGSGCGLPLNPHFSSFGYARKLAGFDAGKWRRVPHLHYPDSRKVETVAKA